MNIEPNLFEQYILAYIKEFYLVHCYSAYFNIYVPHALSQHNFISQTLVVALIPKLKISVLYEFTLLMSNNFNNLFIVRIWTKFDYASIECLLFYKK